MRESQGGNPIGKALVEVNDDNCGRPLKHIRISMYNILCYINIIT